MIYVNAIETNVLVLLHVLFDVYFESLKHYEANFASLKHTFVYTLVHRLPLEIP